MRAKKCIYLIGPPHHQRIVYPVLEALERRGLDIKYIAVSQEPAYESFCIDNNLPFKYEYEYMDKNVEEKITRALKTAGSDIAKVVYGTQEGSEWASTIMSKIVRWVVEDLYIFRDGLIEKEKPDFIIFQNEMNMWSKLLGYVGYIKGIPVVSFQEGMYYSKLYWFKYHNNYSVNLLLSNTSAELLLEAGSNPHRMVVVGNTYFDKMVKEFDENFLRRFKEEKGIDIRKPVVLIIISFADINTSIIDLFQLMLRELEKLPPMNLIFKYHPIMDLAHVNMVKNNLNSNKHKLLHVHTEEVYPYLFCADLCVTTGRSTLVSEALALGKPVIDTSELLGNPDYYGKYGVVVKVKSVRDIALKMADILTEGIDENFKEKMEKFGKNDIGEFKGAIERAGECIEMLVNIKENYEGMRGYMSANVFAYKIGDAFVLSMFELSDNYIDKIYKAFKGTNKEFGVPLINGKYPFVKYDDNEKPVLTNILEEAEGFSGIAILSEDLVDRFGGWIDYSNPMFTLLDISNFIFANGIEGVPLDVNIDAPEIQLVPAKMEKEEDVFTFYVNNLLTRGKKYAV